MAPQIVLSGIGPRTHRDAIRETLARARPGAVGVASAFVSMQGVTQLHEILRRCGEPDCRLVAGTDHAITHPEALYAAAEHGWKVRLGSPARGIFHPKLIVAGRKFSRNGGIEQPCHVYVGSSNLTNGGMNVNVECGFIADTDNVPASSSEVFAALWNSALPASAAALRNYAARFAERARSRAAAELVDLGVNDTEQVPAGPRELRTQKPPPRPALGTDFAVAAWAGLQSFTGEYRFQVEFPRKAGEVINRLIGGRERENGRIDVYCPGDEVVRPMQYRFYPDNSMFRLNVPNDMPGVDWARAHRDGVAIVEAGLPGGAPLRMRIIAPGADALDIVGRSAALGTWGRTSTRTYGWY